MFLLHSLLLLRRKPNIKIDVVAKMQGPICSSITELILCCILLLLTISSPVRGQENQVAELIEVAHLGWTQAAPYVSRALAQVGNYIDSHIGKETLPIVLAGLTYLVVRFTGISGKVNFLTSIFAFVGR